MTSGRASAGAGATPPGRSTRRELGLAIAIACTLVIARSAVFVAFEHAHFDSDQAIVGLMAKHLSEGRAFPLFFYGQTYMLGVEAWLAAPWIWLLGSSVASLKLSLLASNLALAVLLVLGLHRGARLRPLLAVVPALFVLFAPPLVSARLMEAQGGNVEPLLFVVVLWWVRFRPLWFGSLLAIAFLNREFVIYAVPVLLAGDVLAPGRVWGPVVRRWLLTAVAFLLVWNGVQVLTPYADLMGPGTRGTRLQTESQFSNLTQRVNLTPGEWPSRLSAASRDVFPDLVGGRTLDDPLAAQGRDWLGWLLAAWLALVLARIVTVSWREDRRPGPNYPFAWYLLGVGVVAVAAFVMTRPVDNAPLRYVLLGLFVPIGLVALWLRAESSRAMRAAGLAVLAIWVLVAGSDHWRQAERFVSGREPDPMGDLAEALVAEHVQVAEAGYWRAYKLAFLTNEQVVLASTDVVRIAEYQRAAEARGTAIGRLQEDSCADGRAIGGWYLCPR